VTQRDCQVETAQHFWLVCGHLTTDTTWAAWLKAATSPTTSRSMPKGKVSDYLPQKQ